MPNAEHEMGMMMACMIATTLFSLLLVVAVIVQAVLQAKILRELRKVRHDGSRAGTG